MKGAQLAAEFNVVSAELESLSYAVSHDLRAPVRAVLGYARALEEDYGAQLDDEGRRLLSIVAGEASRLGGMIDDVLALSSIGRQSLANEPVDMTSLAREVALEQSHLAARRASIAVVPGTHGDRVLLRDVWSRLFANAGTATRNRPDPILEVWATTDAERVVYHVRDNGVGFDMKYGAKLFSLFQKLHRGADFPGTGAGLAIVQRIVHRHGGTIWADARPGEGATFSFTLPSGRAP